ncbi:T9SS type A sorting domain-containing protein [Halosquirtibacter xylanolyticus]|uniref:C25 family cysteine peptidase n=1 Tax=Halosquirtibacter xylanolyticus TaxID=3374599 RepID=UPI003749589A|nr:T9SS type A sorting domain-containing protein [Prolixibacteraceae bacterium]
MNRLYTFILLMLTCTMGSYAQVGYLSAHRKKGAEMELSNMPKIDVKQSNNKTKVNIDLSACKYFHKKFNNNKEWVFLQIKDFGYIHHAGAPAVPTKQFLHEVKDEYKLEVEKGDFIVHNNIMVHPMKADDIDTEGVPNVPYDIDEAIYSKNEFYPKGVIEIHNVQKASGKTYVTVRINPIQYNPVTKELRIYSNLSYTLKGVENGINRKMKDLYANQIPSYLIVTTNKYRAAANELASWKALQGFNTEVVSRDSWEAKDVKKTIHDKYNNLPNHLQYFLIIGDHEDVPGELYNKKSNGKTTVYASDLYYACLDGKSDYTSDIAHGRISCKNANEANTIVQKVINYEKSPVENPDFYRTALCCAQFQDVANKEEPDGEAARRFCQTSEEVRNYLVDEQGYQVNRVYYTDPANEPMRWNNGSFGDGSPIPVELRRASGFNWDGDAADIKREIEEGKFFVLHRDHGYSGGSGWAHPRFVTRDIDKLENGNLLPVVFSMNCHTGEFKLNECFAEKFVKNPNGGAIGVIAASNFSYSGYNDALTCGMIDALWNNPGLIPVFGYAKRIVQKPGHLDRVERMGDILNQGLLRMQETYYSGGESDIYTHRLFHYFGDPTMKMWTAAPTDITATIPNQVNLNSKSLSIRNISDGSMTISLVQNGKIIAYKKKAVAKKDINLEIENISPQYPLYLGIFGTNKKPIIKEIVISGNTHKPVADFTYIKSYNSIQDDNTPIVFTFDNLSTYIPKSYKWSFSPNNIKFIDDDSNISKNPKVQFTKAGSYTVSLTAKNSNGEGSKTIDTPIKIESVKACTVPKIKNNYYKIINFKIANIDVTSPNNYEVAGYLSHIDKGVAILKKGIRTPFTLSISGSSCNYHIYVDLNNDGKFTNDEKLYETKEGKGVKDKSLRGNITIPENISTKYCNTPLRLRISQFTYWASPSPTEDKSSGQTHDYAVVIRDGEATPMITSVSSTPEKVTVNCDIKNGYDIERKGIVYSTTKAFNESERVDSDAKTSQYHFDFTKLREATTYYFKSYCVGPDGTSYSNVKETTTFYKRPIANPSKLTGRAESAFAIRLKWNKPTSSCQKLWVVGSSKGEDAINLPSPSSDQKEYEVCRVIEGNTKEVLFTNLNADTSYDFKIYACNNTGTNKRFNTTKVPHLSLMTPDNSEYPLMLYPLGTSNMIEGVTFNSIKNNNPRENTGGNFHIFNDLRTNVEIGNKYPLEVQVNKEFGKKYFAKGWFDWNHNLQFENDEEVALQEKSSKIYIADVEIPAHAKVGETVFRVVYSSTDSESQLSPTGLIVDKKGMTEEYPITIKEGVIHTSNKDGIKKMGASAFPNPVEKEMTLTVKMELSTDASYMIYDTNGKCVMQNKITESTTLIQMNLITGIYTLVLINNGERGSKKIIVK